MIEPVIIDDESIDEEDITVRALTNFQTSLVVPRGIFNDNFEGENGHPPDHGKWIRFFCGDSLSEQGYGEKYCDIQDGRLRMQMNGDGSGDGWFYLNCMTRAEFKVPFSLSFQVTIEHNVGQCGNHFMFSFVDPDPNRGFLLNSKLYGDTPTTLWAFDDYEGTDYCWVLNCYGGMVISGENAWEPDHVYNVSLVPDFTDSHSTILTITDNETGDIKFQTNQNLVDPQVKYLRAMFSVYEWAETFTAFTVFYVDNFSVVRSTSKKAKAVVSMAHSVLWHDGDVGNLLEEANSLLRFPFMVKGLLNLKTEL